MGSGFVIAPAPKAQEIAIEDALAPFRAQLEDPLVTDVFVNGSRGMFVDRGFGTEPVPDWTASEREVRELAAELIAQGGRHVDDAHPCVDVRLRGGIRVHAVLAPIATAGTTLSIRIPRFAATTLATLVAQGMIDPPVEAVLREAVARRANLLVSGAAGAGKTTLLSALLGEAPPTERIVTIEDVAEIGLDHPHHVALEARQANLEGAGEVGLARLVREALRMKPDRLVIGECRGAEVRELLSALNTGHDGGAGTVHANSLADVATRLEALGALAGLDETTLARQVTSAIEFVIHLERDADGRRRVAAMGEFRIVDGRLFVVPKEIPPLPVPVATRRSRRQASMSETSRAELIAASDGTVPTRPGAAGASVSEATISEAAISGTAVVGDAALFAVSGVRAWPNLASAGRFVPPRPCVAEDRGRRGSASPDQFDRDDDRPARAAVARSHFTTDGDWHRVAAASRDSLPREVIAVPSARDQSSAVLMASGGTSPGAADSAGGATEPALRRRRATRTAASASSNVAVALSAGTSVGVVLPTFDEWRERLRLAPQSAAVAGNRGASVDTASTHSGSSRRRVVAEHSGVPPEARSFRDDDSALSPRRAEAIGPSSLTDRSQNRGTAQYSVRFRDDHGLSDVGVLRGEHSGRDDGAHDDQTWSEQSMRAMRAPRDAPALSPAELDAQWARLIAGWDTSGDREQGTADFSAAGRGTTQRSLGGGGTIDHAGEKEAATRTPVRERYRGGAWTFVPEPSAPAASEGSSHAGR